MLHDRISVEYVVHSLVCPPFISVRPLLEIRCTSEKRTFYCDTTRRGLYRALSALSHAPMVLPCPIRDSANYSSKNAFKLPWQQKTTRIENSTSSTPGQIGLRILIEPDHLHNSSFTPPLNIVFVHGLGGSAEGTWTDGETNSFWPLWLSKVKGLENARIMTFGYDSSWNEIWKPNNVLDISDFAKQLIHDLWCHYSDYGDVTPSPLYIMKYI